MSNGCGVAAIEDSRWIEVLSRLHRPPLGLTLALISAIAPSIPSLRSSFIIPAWRLILDFFGMLRFVSLHLHSLTFIPSIFNLLQISSPFHLLHVSCEVCVLLLDHFCINLTLNANAITLDEFTNLTS